jgi:hypothetical protein
MSSTWADAAYFHRHCNAPVSRAVAFYLVSGFFPICPASCFPIYPLVGQWAHVGTVFVGECFFANGILLFALEAIN